MLPLLPSSLRIGLTVCCLTVPTLLALGGDRLYSVSPYDTNLRVVDPLTATTLSSVPITAPGSTVLGANGIAVHPVTGELWAMLQIRGAFGRALVKLNPATGVATVIGNTGEAFAGLAFDAIGTLYAVTGDGGNTPETLFTLNLTTAQPTQFLPLGAGNDGETIAYHPPSGLMYHASGWGVQGVDEFFESIDLATRNATNIPLSGGDYEEALAMTWWVGDNFLVGDGFGDLFVVSAAGVVSMIGTLDHTAKGFAFVRRSGAFFDLYGKGFPATGGYVPVLAGSGTPSPNSTFRTGIVNGPGGAPGILLMGLGQNTLQISPICVIQNMPILSFVIPVVLTGSGSGKGSMSLPFQIPAGTQPGDIFFQVVLFEGATPFVTNPLQVHIQ